MQKNNIRTPIYSAYKTKNEVIQLLSENPITYQKFRILDTIWQERIIEFFLGKKTLPLTYDPVFKKIFHPDIHTGRLSHLISSLLRQDVTVLMVLPNEDRIGFDESLLIMDILVQLTDGSLANVEIQKIPYAFPAERMCCYSSDLVMRQYARVKGEKGKDFTYRDIKKVYTIVIFEKTPIDIFHTLDGQFIHYGETRFDTGLKLDMLQNYCLVALDVFKECGYTKDDELTGWLALLATETVAELEALVIRFPWLMPIYTEMQSYLHRPEEVLDMYSDALRILDINTVHYMIEEQKKEIEENKKVIAENKKVIAENKKEISENRKVIAENKKVIAENKKVIANDKKEIAENKKVIENDKKEIDSLKQERAELNEAISEKDLLIEQLKAQIAELSS